MHYLKVHYLYIKTDDCYIICSVGMEVNESDFLCGAALAG